MDLEKLSQREYQVLLHLLHGKTILECSQIMKITYSTAQFHYKNVYRKLQIHTRYDLIDHYGYLVKNVDFMNH